MFLPVLTDDGRTAIRGHVIRRPLDRDGIQPGRTTATESPRALALARSTVERVGLPAAGLHT